MKKIPDNFTPDERSYNNLRKHGVLPDFIDDQLPGFITYWQETGTKKASWQMTLQTWMRRSFHGKAGREWEESRHIRERHSNKPKEDLFQGILQNLNNAKREGDRASTDAAPYKEVPPICGRLDQVKGGRECAGRESSNLIASRSSDKCLPSMTFEQAQAELKRMRIIK